MCCLSSSAGTLYLFGLLLGQVHVETLEAQFLRDAPSAWQRYLDSRHKLQIRIRSKGEFLYKQAKGAALLIWEPHQKSVSAEVRCTNPEYSFRLKRPIAGGPWVLQEIDYKPDADLIKEVQQRGPGRRLYLWNLWLPTLIQDPDFRIQSIRQEQKDGHSLVRVEFIYPKPPEQYPMRGAIRLKGGWFLLDPEENWLPVAYQVYAEEKGQKFYYSCRYYRDTSQDTQRVFMKVQTEIKEGALLVTHSESKQEEWEEDVPLEEFTLSAFGITEPPSRNVGRPWYVWLAWGGILFLLLGLLGRWLLRRYAAASTGK